MKERKGATLKLENGMEFRGFSFGYDGPTDGEVVFSTAMVGYPESLTDPSYSGQILTVTYPLIGNYGVPQEGPDPNGISKNFESERIWVRGLVISDYSFDYSHWDAVKSLDEWLKEQKIPGIFGIDTRAVTQILRERGSMLGMIVPDGVTKDFPVDDPNLANQIALVSCKEPIVYGEGAKTVVMVDCGVKHNILRCFMDRGVKLVRVPWDYDFNTLEYDGLFISNGPGNPEFCVKTVCAITADLYHICTACICCQFIDQSRVCCRVSHIRGCSVRVCCIGVCFRINCVRCFLRLRSCCAEYRHKYQVVIHSVNSYIQSAACGVYRICAKLAGACKFRDPQLTDLVIGNLRHGSVRLYSVYRPS